MQTQRSTFHVGHDGAVEGRALWLYRELDKEDNETETFLKSW